VLYADPRPAGSASYWPIYRVINKMSGGITEGEQTNAQAAYGFGLSSAAISCSAAIRRDLAMPASAR